MKKNLKTFLWLNMAALFTLNLAVKLNVVDAEKLKLTVKQEQALADECGECDLCVIKNLMGKIVFSCKAKPDESCSKSGGLGSVYCNNAEECNND